MTNIFRAAVLVSCLVMALPSFRSRADEAKDSLQGVWVGQSIEADGKVKPADAAKRMRFTFKDGKVLMRGNFADDREEECTYKIDPKQSPKHLDISPAKEKKPILAIYDVKGDELKICIRHASSSDGRPTEFATKADSKLVLIVFKKQQP